MSKNTEISIGDPAKLQTTIDSFLRELGTDVSGALDEAITEVGKEAVEKLKQTSPVRKAKYGRSTGYAKSWRFKKNSRGQSGALEAKVYNEKGNLTHLLEYGHPIFDHEGNHVGDSPAIPHIEQVDQWVQSELPKKFTEKMKNSRR